MMLRLLTLQPIFVNTLKRFNQTQNKSLLHLPIHVFIKSVVIIGWSLECLNAKTAMWQEYLKN